MYFDRAGSQSKKKEEQDYVELAVEAVDFIQREKSLAIFWSLCPPNRI